MHRYIVGQDWSTAFVHTNTLHARPIHEQDAVSHDPLQELAQGDKATRKRVGTAKNMAWLLSVSDRG
jgi:hypothetical protein